MKFKDISEQSQFIFYQKKCHICDSKLVKCDSTKSVKCYKKPSHLFFNIQSKMLSSRDDKYSFIIQGNTVYYESDKRTMNKLCDADEDVPMDLNKYFKKIEMIFLMS